MTAALRIAKTGLDALQTKMSVISNNLANVNTTAYKRSRLIFNDLLYQTIRQPGAQSSQNTTLPSGLMLGTGVRTVATEKIFSQGGIVQTEGPLDVAIAGNGFFEILMPDGSTSYTRDGSFHRNSQGQIVTAAGFVLQPAITLPTNTDTISIGTDGTISALVAGNSSATQIGNLQLTYFINPAGLQPIGANLFKETGASGTATAGTPGGRERPTDPSLARAGADRARRPRPEAAASADRAGTQGIQEKPRRRSRWGAARGFRQPGAPRPSEIHAPGRRRDVMHQQLHEHLEEAIGEARGQRLLRFEHTNGGQVEAVLDVGKGPGHVALRIDPPRQ